MRVKRGNVTDFLVRDGETAVLIDGQVVRLSEVGAAIFDLTEDWMDVDVLAIRLAALFGHPERTSASHATKDAVTELVRHSVLTSAG